MSARVLEYKIQSTYTQVYKVPVLVHRLKVYSLNCTFEYRIPSAIKNTEYSSTEGLST